ncbi:MAG: heavy-metal-associated domain-containing protein [Phycisphaerales bacterium]|nr:heavy-metal-associated domain-containing protein [Phycisphaerales bacterium]
MLRLTLLAATLILTGCGNSSDPDNAASTASTDDTPAAFREMSGVVSVEGMHCDRCAASIQRAMNACPDVFSVAVSYADQSATIHAQSAAAMDCAIRAAREQGYTVGDLEPIPVEDSTAPVESDETSDA